MNRAALMPAAVLPLLYFGFAHLCLALALATLVVRPDLPAGFFHHPRMVALVHLVTLGWITASILGAFYIVAPLALRVPLRPGWKDRLAFGAYVMGVAGMVSNVWSGEYAGMSWAATLVIAAVLHVGARAWSGLAHAPVPWPVKLHVRLAFANMIAASLFGMTIGFNRVWGWFAWPAMAAAFAHAHLAAIGWAVMMVVGLSYRLIPMILPAAMPAGASLARSAVLLEAGVLLLVAALLWSPAWTPAGALTIAAGLAAFVQQVRGMVARRLPPPAALPRPDWATWQTHVAFGWLIIAGVAGILLTLPLSPDLLIPLGWIYGAAGLVGFLAQVVVGIQGRLLPLHGWYRRFEAAGAKPPGRSAHTLASPQLAKAILIAWSAGVPLLVAGLAVGFPPLVAAGSGALLAGVVCNAAQMIGIETAEGPE